jgi:hypothetical protein
MTHGSIRTAAPTAVRANHRKSLGAMTIGIALAATVVGCVAPDTTTSSRKGSTPALGSASSASAPSTTTVAPPIPADFVVGVIIAEQKCFGSAGCSYHYTINPQYISAKPLPEKTTVVFTVTGGEQDQVGNFTIDQDGTATFDRETSISGPEAADLQATVTQVIPGR